MRRALVALVVGALCAGSACEEEPPVAPIRPPAPVEDETPAPVEVEESDEVAESECDTLLAQYLRDREALGRCETAEDCVEEYPGLCPHGPHYVGRGVDRTRFDALTARILETCRLPRCEAPAPLGPADCRDGRCVQR